VRPPASPAAIARPVAAEPVADAQIEALGVWKRFALENVAQGRTSLKALLTDWVHFRATPAPSFFALQDVSLAVGRGEALGIVGRNGSGKTTLLRVLGRVYRPDRGTVEQRGRVASLLGLGGGFHLDYTGRENVEVEAAILGMTRAQLRERRDDILAFADLGTFIDQPLRTYSSGMYMRLAFAVAVHADFDVLLLDEVLAVGDEAFVERCHERMRGFREQGKSLVLVSHDLTKIERWTDRALWLDAGKVRLTGPPEEVVAAYRAFNRAAGARGPAA
jgi:lipopolysaccharide transport system ATP-binding protein